MYKTLLISLLPALLWSSCSLVEGEDTPTDTQTNTLGDSDLPPHLPDHVLKDIA